MKCDQVRPYVESHADGELPTWRRLLLRCHLIACPACAARLEETRLLRDRIRAEIPRFAAPQSLRASVMALAGKPSSRASLRSHTDYRWQWTAAGALAGSVLTMFILFAGNAIQDRRSNEDMASVAVNAHVRATLGNQLTQVASSDQHTVKPWLSARLDYSPPVRDFAADGFPLVGARVEYLDGRPVAVLVYRFREHNVDVFVRPNALRFGVTEPQTIRGFHVLRAEGQGMDWVAVSDAATEALAPLLRRLAESS
jgi:anti-sigma factor RsiW